MHKWDWSWAVSHSPHWNESRALPWPLCQPLSSYTWTEAQNLLNWVASGYSLFPAFSDIWNVLWEALGVHPLSVWLTPPPCMPGRHAGHPGREVSGGWSTCNCCHLRLQRGGSSTWAQAEEQASQLIWKELRELGLELHFYLTCEHPFVQSPDHTGSISELRSLGGEFLYSGSASPWPETDLGEGGDMHLWFQEWYGHSSQMNKHL